MGMHQHASVCHIFQDNTRISLFLPNATRVWPSPLVQNTTAATRMIKSGAANHRNDGGIAVQKTLMPPGLFNVVLQYADRSLTVAALWRAIVVL